MRPGRMSAGSRRSGWSVQQAAEMQVDGRGLLGGSGMVGTVGRSVRVRGSEVDGDGRAAGVPVGLRQMVCR